MSYLPLKNATDDYQQVLDSAASVDLKSILPKPVNPAVLKGYQAQHDLLLSQYESVHSTVMETAWAGGNTVSIAMLKPLSRGSITINTTDPFASPVVDYGTFSHPVDLDVAVASLKKTREWMASAPMQEIGAVETFPGANITSNADIADAIRGFATGTWAHPTSSLSMMSKNLGGVVDTNLSVYGVKGLRVVDASIMPMIIGSHTASTVYAVAEKVCTLLNRRCHDL